MADVIRVCAGCQQERPHAPRADQPTKPRALCRDCTREYLRAYRSMRWQEQKLRNTWRGIIGRCHNEDRRRWSNAPSVPQWRDYGARGIRVCRRWRGPQGFAHFVEDMGPPPTPAHTLDRIRCSRGYSPSNCRWADPALQRANRCNTRWVEARDPQSGRVERRSLTDWQRATGVERRTLAKRLDRGWEPDRAVLPVVIQDVPF